LPTVNLPAGLAYLAVRTLPSSSHDRVHVYIRVQTVAMVMMTTWSAKQKIRYFS